MQTTSVSTRPWSVWPTVTSARAVLLLRLLRAGTRGSSPRVCTTGRVLKATSSADQRCSSWPGSAGVPQRRVLDLRTGVLHELTDSEYGTFQSVRFVSLAQPSTSVLRATCPEGIPLRTCGDRACDGSGVRLRSIRNRLLGPGRRFERRDRGCRHTDPNSGLNARSPRHFRGRPGRPSGSR